MLSITTYLEVLLLKLKCSLNVHRNIIFPLKQSIVCSLIEKSFLFAKLKGKMGGVNERQRWNSFGSKRSDVYPCLGW